MPPIVVKLLIRLIKIVALEEIEYWAINKWRTDRGLAPMSFTTMQVEDPFDGQGHDPVPPPGQVAPGPPMPDTVDDGQGH